MKRMVHVLAIVVLITLNVNAQGKKLKVYVSADMEGVGGVSTWSVQGLPPSREYEQFRHLMTSEVNAAIQGAYDAGARFSTPRQQRGLKHLRVFGAILDFLFILI